jgi:protein-tyrosine phosphatase
LKPAVYERHERLKAFPPAQFVYILYRRIVEQGARTLWLWIQDKIVRRIKGYSPPYLSRVAPHLYVGGQHTAQGLEAMQAEGIHAVVNMREEYNDDEHGVAPHHYLWLPIPDDTAPSRQDLETGATFIQTHIEQGHGVYVHCAAGVGRAPTMAAAYLVHQGATPDEAWAEIRQGRPFIRPTPPQLDVIEAYAEQRQGPQHRAAAQASGTDVHAAAAAAPNPGPTNHDGALDARVQQAFERIAGDAGLTGDLTDAQAKALLAWAESEIRRLVQTTQGMEDARAWETLDPQLAALRRHLRDVARQSARAEHPMAALQAHLSAPSTSGSDGS